MERIAQFYKVTEDRFINDIRGRFPDASKDELQMMYNGIWLPRRNTRNSAGYDFYAPFPFTLNPGESILIHTGIRVKIREGWFLAIVPRSSLGIRYRTQLDNTVGIIDSDYFHTDNEGHIMIKITNDSRENKTLDIQAGMRFAQGIFMIYGITEDDDAQEMRRGGFGSTGW